MAAAFAGAFLFARILKAIARLMADQSNSELARAIQDVTEKAQLLVREEIALAKAEMSEKVSKLIKGAVFGVVAGVFLVFALIYLLHALALGIWEAARVGHELLARLPDRRRAAHPARRDRRVHRHALRQARLAAHAADGHRGGAADQGHADRLARRRSRSGRSAPARRPTPAPGREALMAATRTPEEIRRSIEANRAELGLGARAAAGRGRRGHGLAQAAQPHRKEALIGAAAAGFVLGGGIAAIASLLSGGGDDD